MHTINLLSYPLSRHDCFSTHTLDFIVLFGAFLSIQFQSLHFVQPIEIVAKGWRARFISLLVPPLTGA